MRLSVITSLKTNSYINSSKRNISFRQVSKWYREWWYSSPPEPPYSHIVQIGDPVLRHQAENVSDNLINSKELERLIDHLKYVMRKYKSIGISAPQVGVPWRIFVMELSETTLNTFPVDVRKNRQMKPIDFTVFINPTLKILNYNKITYPEACESVRGFAADVPRYEEVQCTGINKNGEKIIMVAKGWTARIIQHEYDHLEGRIFTDIMKPTSLYCTCWQAVNAYSGRIKLPFSP